MARFQQKILYIYIFLSFELSVLLRRPIACIDLVVIRNKLNISIILYRFLKNVSYYTNGQRVLSIHADKGRNEECAALDFEIKLTNKSYLFRFAKENV